MLLSQTGTFLVLFISRRPIFECLSCWGWGGEKKNQLRQSVFLSPQVQFDFKDKVFQMEASRNSLGGGLWNNPGPRQYSKDTQDMLQCKLMAFLSSHKGDECLFVCVRACVCRCLKCFELHFFSPLVFSDDAGIQAYQPAEKTDHGLPPKWVGDAREMHYCTILRTLMSHTHFSIFLRRNIPTTDLCLPLACSPLCACNCPEAPVSQASETQRRGLLLWGRLCQRKVLSWSHK